MKIKIEYKTSNPLLSRVMFIEVDESASIEDVRRDVHDAILEDLGISKYKWEVIE